MIESMKKELQGEEDMGLVYIGNSQFLNKCVFYYFNVTRGNRTGTTLMVEREIS